MKKNNVIYLLVIFIMISCTEKKKQTESSNQNIESKKVTEADLGDLYKYYHSNPKNLNQRDENTLIEYAADNNISAIRTTSGIFIQTHIEGKGSKINWGDKISVDYKGYTLDGKEFDSSYGRGEPITFRVGNMNPGWNEALPYLTKGTKATFLIPSHMGYGEKGFPGYIDPNTNIAFDVEVLDGAINK